MLAGVVVCKFGMGGISLVLIDLRWSAVLQVASE